MTCHVLHAGDGYTYLTEQVATGDVARSTRDPLAGYYTVAGNPPGQWVGSGCADLGMSGVVTEEHMLALFGEGLRPDANEFIAARIATGNRFSDAVAGTRLGRRFYQYGKDVPLVAALKAAYTRFADQHDRRPTVDERRDVKIAVARTLLAQEFPDQPPPTWEQVRRYLTDELGKVRQPVAGFDLVFSPVKSVSLLWALGGYELQRIVVEVHEAAWRAALAYGEQEAAFTRIGKDGIAQVPTRGFVATAFEHRDSRAGDPDLHTHVVIANRVLAADGTWRTVDSKQLHAVAVSMSELYNAMVEQGLSERLGVDWVEVTKGTGKRVVREIAGMPTAWIRGFSRRREQVEANYAALVAEYVRRYGHTPPRSTQMRLAQQATLEDRPTKQLRTLAQQMADWTAAAHTVLPGVDMRAVIAGCIHPERHPDSETTVDVDVVASTVIDVVSTERSTWNVYHVRAEAQRQLKGSLFPTGQARQNAVEMVVGRALTGESFPLAVQMDAVPRLLRRIDGESVFHRHGSERFTSQAILDAETALVTDAHVKRGPVVARHVLNAAVRRFERASDKTLNPGQRALVEHFVSCGRAVAVAIGPPGTGKSTAMRAVREAWETTSGRVIGLAPSAAAASVLGDELGVRADTLHRLIVAYEHGVDIDVEAGDMLLVDEAGMAGTRTLEAVRRIAAERDAVLRLVGDHRQLAAVEAGGALRLLHNDAGGVELSEVHRFAREDESAAVLAFRVGDESAIDFYATNNRLVGGVRAAVLDRLYADWRADGDAGRTSIMISDSNEVVRELSARAQTERRAAGVVEATGVALHDGTVAGVGDRVVTRLNRRRLAVLGGRDYVKNGDLWEVTHRRHDGRLTVRHVEHGGAVVLPAWYVADYTELGYAATIHRSQGLTVDMARSFLSLTAVREAALVALSRGIYGNYAYLDTEQMLDPDEPEVLPGDLFYRYRNASDTAAALTVILRREGAERSATEELRDALEAPYRLDTAIPEFVDALYVHRGPDAMREAEDWVRQAVPQYVADVVTDEAWPVLCQVLHEARDAGADPIRLLARRAAQRALETDPHDPARSVAQVLHYRIVEHMPAAHPGPQRAELLPGWVPTPPTSQGDVTAPDEVAELGEWLRHRARHIADRVHILGERAADQPPAWAVHLEPVPDDPAVREVWIARAGQVAAYRERYRLDDTEQALLPGGQRGEQARARAWVQQFLVDHPLPTAPAPAAAPFAQRVAARTARLRERFVELSELLNQPATSTDADAGHSSAAPGEPDTDIEDESGQDVGPAV
ncbi:MAG TPA: MobF family relaxase [Pseudonocardiaceae bacterium]|nr:MobF family relaxase [Pseudonocardiaceae bacterium]